MLYALKVSLYLSLFRHRLGGWLPLVKQSQSAGSDWTRAFDGYYDGIIGPVVIRAKKLGVDRQE